MTGPCLRRFLLGLILGCAALLAGCGDKPATSYAPDYGAAPPAQPNQYRFAVHPLHNPERLFAIYGPLADYLTAHIPGSRFILEASRNYEEFDRKLYAREFHFALPNPYQTVRALPHGYKVLAKMGDDDVFRGIILVRRDSGIRQVADLKGKAVSFPAATALAATLMPLYYLHKHGLDANRDIDIRYVGSQESSIMNVVLGNTAAGATWPPPWQRFQQDHPEQAAQLEVRWETETLPNNGLVVRDDVPPAIAQQVRELLLKLHQNAEGQAILAAMPLSRFDAADSASYDPVRRFIATFSRELRPLEP